MKGIVDTSSSTYRQIMGNGIRYEIPKFQRDYTWEAEQWDDLWQDIQALERGEEDEHYLGYLVLQTIDQKTFQVIDGQQRLTTMSLIILATIKCLQELGEQGEEEASYEKRKETLLNSYIGYIDPVTLISENKLKLNRNSDDYYRQYLVLLKDLPIRNTNNAEKQLREGFLWYYERIAKTYTTGEALARFINDNVDKLFFTVIRVNNQVNAFKVFETLNARGVQLSAADLLKNYLFSVVDKTGPHTNEIEELEKIWSKIVGRLGSQKFEDYLRYYWNSYHKNVSKKNLFKEVRKEVNTKELAFQLLRDLLDTVDLYMAIHDPNDSFWQDNPEIRVYLQELKMFQIKQTNALFIAAYKNLPAKSFTSLVRLCAIVSFRYNIIGGLNPNAQEDVYNDIALKIQRNKTFDKKDLAKIYVEDPNFLTDFSTKTFKNTTRNHKIVKYILAKMEWYKYQNEIALESDIFTVEHILPESADESWGDFSQEAINRSVYRLGNLTLLEKDLNRKCDTSPYTEKLSFYNKSSANLTLNLGKHYESWDENKLASRQTQLAKEAKSIWKIDF